MSDWEEYKREASRLRWKEAIEFTGIVLIGVVAITVAVLSWYYDLNLKDRL